MGDSPNPFGQTPSLVRNFGLGFIAYWHSSLGSIPAGWTLCNGENGTPDLLDQVIYGAGITPVGNSGGNVNHTHAFTGDGHTHKLGQAYQDFLEGADYDNLLASEPATGTTNNGSSLPPYHGLLPIMEL